MENELLRSRLSIRISPRSEESTRTSESATLRGTRRHEAGLFTIYEDNSDETTTKEAKGMEPLQEKGGPIMARGEWVEDVLAEFLGSGSGDEISGYLDHPSSYPPITMPRHTSARSTGSSKSSPSSSSKSHSTSSNHQASSNDAGKKASSEKPNPKDFPGRYPTGNTSIDLGAINLALGQTVNGEGEPSITTSHGGFPTFAFGDASPYLVGPSTSPSATLPGSFAMQRQAPSPVTSPQGGQGNNASNNGGAQMNNMVGMSVNAGQQMDVHMVYQKVLELSEILKENRERTQGIVAGAEELAARAAANGASPSLQDANAEVSAARIADLARQVHGLEKAKAVLLREQRENTKLIGEYETAMGSVVEMVRNFAANKDAERFAAAREYNGRLQEEKDAHLATRLDRDDWHAKFMRSVEMIRNAYRLRCEEDELPIRIVAGLQNEVRTYRNALGMEPEKFEEEFGYEILKDVKNGAGEP